MTKRPAGPGKQFRAGPTSPSLSMALLLEASLSADQPADPLPWMYGMTSLPYRNVGSV